MKIDFYSFRMGDVDDVDIYAAGPIHEWQQTAKGQWVMAHAQDLKYYTAADTSTFGFRVTIRGELQDRDATEYFLRYSEST